LVAGHLSPGTEGIDKGNGDFAGEVAKMAGRGPADTR
jgi:hypothetical protein